MLYGLDDTGRQVHRFNMEGFAVYVRRGAQLRRVRYCTARVLEVTTPPGGRRSQRRRGRSQR